MKLFGIVLIAGYFLARGREPRAGNALHAALRDWAVCLFSAAVISYAGLFLKADPGILPVIVLLSAACLTVVFKSSAECMLGSSALSFWILKAAPDWQRMLLGWAAAGGAMLVIVFFYLGARERMLRLPVSLPARGPAGKLLVLLALAGVWAILYQKIVQIL